MRNRLLVDGRNMLDPDALRAHGFAYEGIGRPQRDVSLPAVILVGGQGTRLRPLTDRTRKDMLPLVDRPLLAYTFEHLARHGVERGDRLVRLPPAPDRLRVRRRATAASRSSTRSRTSRSARAARSGSPRGSSRARSSR